MTTTPEPQPTDYRTVPPAITPVAEGWQAWWENHDFWDGYLLYADLDVAKHHTAVAYVGEEYSWIAGDDPADEAPNVELTWAFEHQRWHLLDSERSTGVQLYVVRAYAAVPAVLPSVSRAAVLREAADRLDADMARFFAEFPEEPHDSPYALGRKDAVTDLRRMAAEEQPAAEDHGDTDPTPLRWGLSDTLWGDDDTVTVLLSGPDREPYWLELDPERAAVLREDLGGPDGEQPPEPELPATTCSAQLHNLGEPYRLCIRAAHHAGLSHTDENGMHWSETVAVYPLADGTLRQSPGIAEMRRMLAAAPPAAAAPAGTEETR